MSLRLRTLTALLAAVPAACLTLGPAVADPVEDFYKGKQLRLVIGYSPGGGYDIYGRLTAEFLGRFIPGQPRIVPQNMPGAGSMVAARHLHGIAAKDGTVLATLAQTLPLDVVIQGKKAGFKIEEMPYVGRMTSNIDYGMGPAPDKARFKTFDDLRKTEFVVAATAGSSPANIYPKALNRFAGTKFKIIVGYPGSQDMVLALERGEVDIVGANGLASTLVRHPTWITKGERVAVYQAALTRHPLLPNTPTLAELGTTPEGKAVLGALDGSSAIGRSLMTTPGVPRERLAALRKAFRAMLKDKAFLAAVEKRHLLLDPASGEELDRIAQAVGRLPANVIKQLADMVKK